MKLKARHFKHRLLWQFDSSQTKKKKKNSSFNQIITIYKSNMCILRKLILFECVCIYISYN